MYSDLIKEHKQKRKRNHARLAKLKNDATVAVGKVSSVFLEDINKGVAEIYTNQHNIENAAKSLQTQTAIFSKQTGKWMEMYKGLNDALLSLGDVKNWAETMEGDLRKTAECLEKTIQIREDKCPDENPDKTHSNGSDAPAGK